MYVDHVCGYVCGHVVWTCASTCVCTRGMDICVDMCMDMCIDTCMDMRVTAYIAIAHILQYSYGLHTIHYIVMAYIVMACSWFLAYTVRKRFR